MDIAWKADFGWSRGAWSTGPLMGLALVALGMVGAGCANSGGAPACDGTQPSPFYRCCASSAGPEWSDIINDPDNCGGCGTTCPSRSCREGMCVAGPGPTDGGVTPPPTDGGGGPTGMCTPACSASQRCCGSTCVSRTGVAVGGDGRTDPSFGSCNGCGIACDAERASACSVPGGGAGTPRCMCGIYDQCAAGQVCVIDGGEFACVNTQTDANNCGEVGNACAEGESCVSGSCSCNGGPECGSGQACCGSGCVDVQSDEMNCGACGTACSGDESCQSGMCVCGSGAGARACAAPMAGTFGMGGSLGESCCGGTCVANTDTNCGCGVACDTAADETCQVGGGGFLPGMMTEASICCGGAEVALLGCGGGLPGGDGGFPFP